MPRTASTDDANARGRCATRCYIRRLIDRRAQAPSNGRFRRERLFHNHAFRELPKMACVGSAIHPAILGLSDFFAALSNSTIGMQLTCAN